VFDVENARATRNRICGNQAPALARILQFIPAVLDRPATFTATWPCLLVANGALAGPAT
jgi:hypothetical protein